MFFGREFSLGKIKSMICDVKWGPPFFAKNKGDSGAVKVMGTRALPFCVFIICSHLTIAYEPEGLLSDSDHRGPQGSLGLTN